MMGSFLDDRLVHKRSIKLDDCDILEPHRLAVTRLFETRTIPWDIV